MVKVREDLTDRIFGKLKVIEQAEDYVSPKGGHRAKWKCQCECGNIIEVSHDNLKRHHTCSCGCALKEFSSKILPKINKRYNQYEVKNDYVVMYTTNDIPFYIDLEDFEKVRNICWHIDKHGYIIGWFNNKHIKIHRLIMNAPDNMVVDHRNHDKCDNRKENLRVVTTSQNMMNRQVAYNSKSNITGVTWNCDNKKWRVQITENGNKIHLGYFEDFDDAIKARKEAEQKYFGEYSYDSSQELVRK